MEVEKQKDCQYQDCHWRLFMSIHSSVTLMYILEVGNSSVFIAIELEGAKNIGTGLDQIKKCKL